MDRILAGREVADQQRYRQRSTGALRSGLVAKGPMLQVLTKVSSDNGCSIHADRPTHSRLSADRVRVWWTALPRGHLMHAQDLAEWRHEHVFDTGNTAGERGTRLVMWITAARGDRAFDHRDQALSVELRGGPSAAQGPFRVAPGGPVVAQKPVVR